MYNHFLIQAMEMKLQILKTYQLFCNMVCNTNNEDLSLATFRNWLR